MEAGPPHKRAVAENPIAVAFSHRMGLSASSALWHTRAETRASLEGNAPWTLITNTAIVTIIHTHTAIAMSIAMAWSFTHMSMCIGILIRTLISTHIRTSMAPRKEATRTSIRNTPSSRTITPTTQMN